MEGCMPRYEVRVRKIPDEPERFDQARYDKAFRITGEIATSRQYAKDDPNDRVKEAKWRRWFFSYYDVDIEN
jgi:hypothetical protein